MKNLLMILIVIFLTNCGSGVKPVKIEIPERTEYTKFEFKIEWFKEEYKEQVRKFLSQVLQRDREREADIEIREEIIQRLNGDFEKK